MTARGRSRHGLLVAALLLPLLALGTGPARAQGVDAQGWWSAAHRAAVPVAPPAPPDVGDHDLLLQGGDPGRVVPAGVVDGSPAPTAVGALRFQLDPGAQVGPLVLEVSTGAQAADVRAYPTAARWQPAQNGAIEDAPAPDLSRYCTGRLSADGTSLVFDDIARLVSEAGLLSVVLVAGPADRVVVHQPSARALAVQPGEPAQPEPGPALTPAPLGPALDPAPPAVAGPPGLQALPAPQVQPLPPAVVPGPVAAAPGAAPAAVVRRVLPDDARDRVVVALEALLVAAFFGLLGVGPLAPLARLTGVPADSPAAERGIGRFRSARVGAVPRL